MIEMKKKIPCFQTSKKHLLEVDLRYQEGSMNDFDGY